MNRLSAAAIALGLAASTTGCCAHWERQKDDFAQRVAEKCAAVAPPQIIVVPAGATTTIVQPGRPAP